jgi:hypothetical protein
VALQGLLACSSPQSPEPAPSLSKFTEKLPKPVPPPPPPPPIGPTVEEVLDDGCSTEVVVGLSEQIIAEGNCMRPGAYERFPVLANVELDAAVFPYMRRPARDALVEAVQARDEHALKINSMLRTVAQQYLLYDWYERGRCGIKLAALPGKSNHQGGLAVDVTPPRRWRGALSRHGFRWMGQRDRWHFDYVGDKAKKGSDDELEGLDIRAFQRLWNRNHPDEPITEDAQWGHGTERALRRAPAGGFAVGAVCDVEDMEDLEDAIIR